MHAIYLVSVWLHILAAITWIGGMAFLTLVVVPWLRRGGRAQAGALFRETGPRFRDVGWTCFGILLVTGTFNLWMRGVRLGDFARAEWLGSPFGMVIVAKLSLFVLAVGVSAYHDFVVGPAATRALGAGPGSPEAEALRKRASVLGRMNAVVALLIVFVAVMIVRGTP